MYLDNGTRPRKVLDIDYEIDIWEESKKIDFICKDFFEYYLE